MKAIDKKKINKNKPKTQKPPKQKILIVAQELKFARLLAGNEKTARDRVLKALKKWLQNCFVKEYEFKEEDFVRVWKGLFYAVWMSDKPLVQEELCENISALLDLFPEERHEAAVLMMKAAFKVLATEWYGIDQHRLDKFMMLVRRYLRACLRTLLKSEWSLQSCKRFTDMLSAKDGIFNPQTPVYARNAISLQLHICDCYLEELSKVSSGKIPELSLVELLKPFAKLMSYGSDHLAIGSRKLFTLLLRQSEKGIEYQEKLKAWEMMGCPEGGPDALEKESDDENDEENGGEIDENSDIDDETPLDPRAGRVDVMLTPLPVPAKEIAVLLRSYLKNINGAAHTRVKIQVQRFEKLSENQYPLPVREDILHINDETDKLPKIKNAAKSLRNMEKQKFSEDDIALRGLSRKHRKRLLAKSRAGQSIAKELDDLKKTLGVETTTNGQWQVEETNTENKEKTENKENLNKKSKKRKNKEETNSPPKKQKTEEKPKQKKEKLKIIIKEKKEKKIPLKFTITESPKKEKPKEVKTIKKPVLTVNKVKNFQKQVTPMKKSEIEQTTPENTPKRVKFVLKNNSMQKPVDYYKSVRQSPSIPYDGSKRPKKTNLKPNSTPSPINPFFKKKLRLRK